MEQIDLRLREVALDQIRPTQMTSGFRDRGAGDAVLRATSGFSIPAARQRLPCVALVRSGHADCRSRARSTKAAPPATHQKDLAMRPILLRTCALALAAAVSTPAFSQGSSTGSTAIAPSTTDSTVRRDSDRGFDWGWLGLLGLAGLIGLRRQPEAPRVDTTRPTAQR